MATNITATVEAFAQASDNLSVRTTGTSPRICLLSCPACGESFTDADGVPLQGRKKSSHIARHTPADFGLTPLGGAPDGR